MAHYQQIELDLSTSQQAVVNGEDGFDPDVHRIYSAEQSMKPGAYAGEGSSVEEEDDEEEYLSSIDYKNDG